MTTDASARDQEEARRLLFAWDGLLADPCMSADKDCMAQLLATALSARYEAGREQVVRMVSGVVADCASETPMPSCERGTLAEWEIALRTAFVEASEAGRAAGAAAEREACARVAEAVPDDRYALLMAYQTQAIETHRITQECYQQPLPKHLQVAAAIRRRGAGEGKDNG